MMTITMCGVVGVAPQLTTINGKGYYKIKVSHKVNKDATMWVTAMVRDTGKSMDWLTVGDKMMLTGNPTFECYEGKVMATVWANQYTKI